MIAKGKAIAHGTNAIRYVMREGKLDRLLGCNLIEGRTPEKIVSEFEMMAQGHERCKNKYLRFEIGIAPADEERVRGSLRELATLFAQEMKLANHQWIACSHKDTGHMHIHLIANRIGIDGSVYDTTFLGNRSARVAEEISRKNGLTVANEVRKRKKNRSPYADPKREAVKAEVRSIAYEELGKQADFRKFYMAMLRRGVLILPAMNNQGNVYGLHFHYGGLTFKASEIGREFGYRTLQKQFPPAAVPRQPIPAPSLGTQIVTDAANTLGVHTETEQVPDEYIAPEFRLLYRKKKTKKKGRGMTR